MEERLCRICDYPLQPDENELCEACENEITPLRVHKIWYLEKEDGKETG